MIKSYKIQRFFRERTALNEIKKYRVRLKPEIESHISNTKGLSLIHREKAFLSQYGEGGLIASLLNEFCSKPGPTLEFGFSIFENNSIASILQSERVGYYIDGSNREVALAQRLIEKQKLAAKIKLRKAFISVDNINQLICDFGLSGEIDYLSIDIDGNDFWIWKAIEVISPRIVSVEYNASFGPSLKVTVPYLATFDRHKYHISGLCHGASFSALIELGKLKGYTCLGADSAGLNLYFLRNDIAVKSDMNVFEEVKFRPHLDRLSRGILQFEQEKIALSANLVTIDGFN